MCWQVQVWEALVLSGNYLLVKRDWFGESLPSSLQALSLFLPRDPTDQSHWQPHKAKETKGNNNKNHSTFTRLKESGKQGGGRRKSPGQSAGSPAEHRPSHFSKAWGPWGRRGRAPSCDGSPEWGPMVWEGRSFHKPGEEKRAEDHPRLSQHPP